MPELQIEYLKTGALKPYPRNTHIHGRKQIRQIVDTTNSFSCTNPLLIDKDNIILAGHGRLAAAEYLGMRGGHDACPEAGLYHCRQ